MRQFRADFAWPERKILLEVQGGIFMPGGKGGHNRGAYMELEYEKQNEAVRLGWAVYKFGPKWCHRQKRTARPSKALEFMFRVLGKTEALPIATDISSVQVPKRKSLEPFV